MPAMTTENNIEFAEFVAAAAEGQLPKLKGVAYTGVPMRVQGFYYPVVVDLDSVKPVAASIPLLRDHDPMRVAGHVDSATVMASKMKCEASLSGIADHTNEVVHNSQNGYRWQLSIGANGQREFHEEGKTVKVNGRNWTGPLYVMRNSEIREISVVALGADGATAASVAASFSLSGGDTVEFSQWLAARGHADESKLSADQLAVLRACYDHDKKVTPPPVATVVAGSVQGGSPPPVIDVNAEMTRFREQMAADVSRVNRINEIVATHNVKGEVTLSDGSKVHDLAAHAVKTGMDVRDVELVAMRAGRPQGPHFHVPKGPEANANVIEVALLQAGGYFRELSPERRKEEEARYGDQTMQAAHTVFRGRIGVQQAITFAAKMHGYTGSDMIRDSEDIRAAFNYAIRGGSNYRPDIAASTGFSGADLTNVLANVQNKYLLEGYNHVDDSFKYISATASVKDFKPTKSINLLSDVVFKELGATGEIQHGNISDEAYANQAKTYAIMLAITREHIINDDLNALSKLPRMVGRGAALKRNDVFWTKFLADTAIFNTDNSKLNYYADAAAVLSSASLSVLVQKFRDQKDPKNQILGLTPKILLVPTALETKALELMKGMNVVYGGSTAAMQPNINIFAGRFQCVVSPYLTASATAWYLLADPLDLPLIEVCYLSGNEAPIIQTAEASFNTLGIQMRGVHDFGVEWQNYRAGQKSKGAA